MVQSGFIHRSRWTLINFIRLHLNQSQRASPTVITWTGTWRHDTFAWHDRIKNDLGRRSHALNWTSRQSYFLAVILSRHVLKNTTVKWLKKQNCFLCQNLEAFEAAVRLLWRLAKFCSREKRFLIRSLCCRAVYLTLMLCVMVDITALYRKMLKNWKFSKESRHFLGCRGRQPRILCKMCFSVVLAHLCKMCYRKFEATVKEVVNLNWEYYKNNLVCWKREATNDENTRSKYRSSSSGTYTGVGRIV